MQLPALKQRAKEENTWGLLAGSAVAGTYLSKTRT
jgi:hypothetical protein